MTDTGPDTHDANPTAEPLALRSSDWLGPLRAALDGLAFAAFQAGSAGEPLLGDCEDVVEWIAHTMATADEALAAERERWRETVQHAANELSELDDETAQVQAAALRELCGPNVGAKLETTAAPK
jgi:hypothetical protein